MAFTESSGFSVKAEAVIGAGLGDEGKGRVVDYLCSQGDVSLVIRFCGGHQAAHHVMAEGVDHVFSNFGSGTLRGIPTYWSHYCTVDPFGLRYEHSLLEEKGVKPILYIDERCPVTLMLDKVFNTSDSDTISHGTCGVGFGATIQRDEARYRLRFGDLGFPSVVKAKYELIQKYYDDLGVADLLQDGGVDPVARLLDAAELECIRPVMGLPLDLDLKKIVFEGSQGLLLDKDIGFFPHVTRANTGYKNIGEIYDFGGVHITLVTRAYQTRHGIGPMTNEDIPHNIMDNPYEVQDEEGSQGKFRIGILDVDLLEYAIKSDTYIRYCHNKTLFITCMDLVQNDLRFTYKGNILGFQNEDKFIDEIRGILGIDCVIVSKSPLIEPERK